MTRPRPRAGYALIECLVLISVLSVLIALCAGMIHLLLKLDRAGRDASDEAVDLARLARDFRDDAHASAPIDPPGRPLERLVLPIDGVRRIEYSVRPGDVLRTAFEGDKARRFESYRRPARSSIRIEVVKDGARPIASMIIDRPGDDRGTSPYRDYRIEAELGRHRRLNPRAE